MSIFIKYDDYLNYDEDPMEYEGTADNYHIFDTFNFDTIKNEAPDYSKINFVTKMSNGDRKSQPKSTSSVSSLISVPMEENKRKIIVLDLDNTLVHASFSPIPQYDFVITVPGMGECDDTICYHVQKRPGVDLLLQRLTQYNYIIIVFTSAQNAYADAILNKLQRDNNITIDFRLYRDSCTMMVVQDDEEEAAEEEERHKVSMMEEEKIVMVKDLSRLGSDLNNVIIVDDDPSGYVFQPENAVPVKVFNGDLTDRDLWKVIDLCKVAATCGDVREAIRAHAFVTYINEKYACSLRQRQRERERQLCGFSLSRNKKTIVLEMFDVLISTAQSPHQPYDFIISVIEGEETVPLYVAIRPGLHQLFSELHNNYEIIVFTEAHHETADVILGKIDVNFDISRRFYRDHCKRVGDLYVKDLKKIGVDFSNVIIVDHNPSSYKFQPENGISLKRFQGDVNDRELFKLIDFCNVAVTYEDVRRAICLNRASNNP